MDFEKEAEELWQLMKANSERESWGESDEPQKWLRQFAAKVLREASNDLAAASSNKNYREWLTRRATEIERG